MTNHERLRRQRRARELRAKTREKRKFERGVFLVFVLLLILVAAWHDR